MCYTGKCSHEDCFGNCKNKTCSEEIILEENSANTKEENKDSIKFLGGYDYE